MSDYTTLTQRVTCLELDMAMLRLDLSMRDIEAKAAEGAIRETRWDPNSLRCRIDREAGRGVLSGLRRERIRRRYRAHPTR